LLALLKRRSAALSSANRKNSVGFIHAYHHIVVSGVPLFLKLNNGCGERRNVEPKSAARSVGFEFVGQG
jgi:hypothetical protein